MRWASRSWAERVVEGEQRAGVTRADHAGRDPLLHGGRQVQQPERVADVRAGPADLLRELLVGRAEVVKQLLISGGLFERVELLPVQVLEQRVAQHVGVGRLAHDRRDVLESGLLGRAPAALAHDELVVPSPSLLHHDRLEQADLGDGGGQFFERFLVEGLPRLARIRRDRADRDFLEVRARDLAQSRVGGVASRG